MRAALTTIQGDRCLCSVNFEADPDDTDTHMIEVVYEVHRPADMDFTIDGDPFFMERLSSTRTDTREPAPLTPDQILQVKTTVIRKITDSRLWGT
jgi:hypothetical protein